MCKKNNIKVKIKKLPHGNDLPLPYYATTESAGMDLYAALNNFAILNPLERLIIPTGIIIAIPNGFEGQIRPRSGLSIKYGITVLNSPGTIDSDYRGEIKICLINLGDQSYEIKRGDRIAQIIINPVFQIIWDDKAYIEKTETNRDIKGFGSSGR
ncbi:MAG: dUTP diphosphatase [Wolbachia endosymbiont of Menacanthus eurysternus]|nr:MAG: dUTP diphosphatase [Wolbachia endosymbiont of Menacanthus eurysternus]